MIVCQFVFSQLFGSGQQSGNGLQGSSIPAFVDRPDASTITNATNIPVLIAPIWPENSSLDISVYVSSSFHIPSLSSFPDGSKVLEEKRFSIGDWNENREIVTSFAVPKQVQQNGTLWAHFYIALTGHQLDPSAKDYDSANAVHFLRPLSQYLPKKKVKKLKNLLGSANETEEEEDTRRGVQIGSFYHPNFTISIIPDFGTKNYLSMHPAVRQYVQLERTNARDATGQNGWYYPVVFVNTFWQLRSHMTELNSTVERLPLRVSLNNLKNWKFSICASVDESVKQTQRQAASGGPMPAGGDGSEFEKFKEILLDTNIYLLATTGIDSILHMVFEGLAFKNDIVSGSFLTLETVQYSHQKSY